jgi:UPF0716 protein FxsA
MIEIGGVIGALNTIFIIFFTAITGIYFAKLEGLNTMRSALSQIKKDEIPVYEIISGATLAFAALLLIIPGFLTDIIGFLLIIPFTRNKLIKIISPKFDTKETKKKIIKGESEEINQNNDNSISN